MNIDMSNSSPSYTAGRSGQKVLALVNHIMDGPYEGSINWLCRANGDSSAHFCVARDGRVAQLVSTDSMAWANGIIKSPDMNVPWLADAVNRGINPNNLTISIEHEGHPFDADYLPETQYQASLALQKMLVAKYGIKADRQHIIGHYQIDNITRHNCPGPKFPFDRLVKDLSLGVTPNMPIQQEDPNVIKQNAIGREMYIVNDGKATFADFYRSNKWLGFARSGLHWSDKYGRLVQWFDKGRLELDPTSQKVGLGNVGLELFCSMGVGGVDTGSPK